MKRFRKAILIYLSIIFVMFSSCRTAITAAKSVPEVSVSSKVEEPVMDFIGFKMDAGILGTDATKRNSYISELGTAQAIVRAKSMRNLGKGLELNRLAKNKEDFYFGIYSLQELDVFRTDSKYVTFVEVSKANLSYVDNGRKKQILGGISGGLLASGVSTIGTAPMTRSITQYVTDGIALAGGLRCLIPALIRSKTIVKFEGLYNICVYDTETKQLIKKERVNVFCSEKFKGSYTYDEPSKDIVREYISQNVYNEIMKKYYELDKWVRER